MEILFDAKVTPSGQLLKMMQDLQKDRLDHNPELKKALRVGARYLMNQGKRRLREGENHDIRHTGNLARSMVIHVKSSNLGALVGFRNGEKNGRIYEGYHSWLVDQGSGPRKTLKGYYRGKSGHGKNGPAGSLSFWTTTKNEDTGEALLMVEDGIQMAFDKIMGAI